MSKKRLKSDAADWHVYTRGSRRMALFRDDQDCRVFLKLLEQALELSGCVLWAYVLMTNHYHLALRGGSQELRRCMHYLNGFYSKYHNERYGLSGHAFEGPYEACRQGSLALLLRTIAYILLNPVTAHKATHPADYPWSSQASVFGGRPAWVPIDLLPLLRELDPDFEEATAAFHRIFERERRRLQAAGFKPGLTAREIQAAHFDWLAEEAALRRESLEGFDPKTLAIHWAQECGFHRGALALALGGPMTSTLRSELTRFRRWLSADPDREARFRLP